MPAKTEPLSLTLSPAPLPAGLYIVATPIGNLKDITLRALETLHAVDLIACEDTRTSRKLLDHYSVATPLTSYHDHNAAEMRPRMIEDIRRGKRIALISDAGTPLIADPGYKLVKELMAADLPVTTLPGPSALISALTLVGLPTDRFCFLGFLPDKPQARTAFLKRYQQTDATLACYITPHKLAAQLAVIADALGERPAALARELTKLYEEVITGSLGELARKAEQEQFTVKGELVLVIAPPDVAAAPDQQEIDTALHDALARMSVSDAARFVAEQYNLPKRPLYARALEFKP